MVVQGDELNMIHLSEINTIVIESMLVNITSSLVCELMKNKVKVTFCDEKHNPQSEIIPYYGSHNTSKKIGNQIHWEEQMKKTVWTQVIQQKIMNQANLLHRLKLDNADKLYEYAMTVEQFDMSNREGHAAKVYFNTLFGKKFNRDEANDINAALDYGYSILLSNFNKEIVANGYLTQIGIKHINEYNYFNLSSDFMEPFRIVIDKYVYEHSELVFDGSYKHELINLLNLRVKFNEREYYLENAIQIYLNGVFKAIENQKLSELLLFQYP